jgi:hypothetical protein
VVKVTIVVFTVRINNKLFTFAGEIFSMKYIWLVHLRDKPEPIPVKFMSKVAKLLGVHPETVRRHVRQTKMNRYDNKMGWAKKIEVK